jgi:putative ABC transport system permease protein
MRNDRSVFWELVLRIESAGIEETLAHCETQWKRFNSYRTFRYRFLTAGIERMYRRERREAEVVALASFLAIFVSSLGVFGLVSFSAERRTQEIGVRKVLGATRASLVALLSREVVIIGMVATAFSLPVSFWVASQWLQNFAYRFSPGTFDYGVGGLGALLLASSIAGYQSLRASGADPVKSLRYE